MSIERAPIQPSGTPFSTAKMDRVTGRDTHTRLIDIDSMDKELEAALASGDRVLDKIHRIIQKLMAVLSELLAEEVQIERKLIYDTNKQARNNANPLGEVAMRTTSLLGKAAGLGASLYLDNGKSYMEIANVASAFPELGANIYSEANRAHQSQLQTHLNLWMSQKSQGENRSERDSSASEQMGDNLQRLRDAEHQAKKSLSGG